MKIEIGNIGSSYAKVWLDGVGQNACIVADTEGFITRYRKDAMGKFIVTGDHVETEDVKGVVRVEFWYVPDNLVDHIRLEHGDDCVFKFTGQRYES